MNRVIITGYYRIRTIYITSILIILFCHVIDDDQNLVKQLVKIMDDPSQPLNARVEAALLIGKLGDTAKEAIPSMISVLKRLRGSELEPLQVAIIDSLAHMGYSARIALPALSIASGRSSNIDLAIKKTTNAILNALDERDVTSLVMQLGSNDPSQRLRAVDALRRLGESAKQALPELLTLLEDADYTVRNAAVEASLAILGNQKVPDVIIRTIAKDLNEADPAIKLLALYRLGKLGTVSAIVADEINKLRNDNDINVRRVAQEVLDKIIGVNK